MNNAKIGESLNYFLKKVVVMILVKAEESATECLYTNATPAAIFLLEMKRKKEICTEVMFWQQLFFCVYIFYLNCILL